MLKTLNFEVNFATTGKIMKGSHTFEKGMTAIVGANESGKSMRIEMFRYAWFGTKALRSQVNRYKSLGVESSIVLDDVEYKVIRSLNSAKLKRNGVDIASGTQPVNNAIIQLFGYDLEVFDISNACLQNQIEALSDKTPAERKKMVDRTIGLGAVDELISDYTAEISAASKMVSVMEQSLASTAVDPIEPLDELLNETELSVLIRQFESLVMEKLSLESAASSLYCEPPLARGDEFHDYKQEELEVKLNELNQLESTKASLVNQLSNIRDVNVEVTTKNIRELEDYLASEVYVQWELVHDYNNRNKKFLEGNIYTDRKNLEGIIQAISLKPSMDSIRRLEHDCNSVTCPHCAKDFSLNHQKLAELREAIGDVNFDELDGYLKIARDLGISSHSNATNKLELLNQYDEFLKEPQPSVPQIEFLGTKSEVESRLRLYQSEIDKLRIKNNLLNEIAQIDTKLGEFTLNKKEMYGIIQYKKELEVHTQQYNRQLDKYHAYEAKLKEATDFNKNHPGVEEALQNFKNRYDALMKYQAALSFYEEKLKLRESYETELAMQVAQVEQLKAIRKGLMDLKPKVQSYLLPSLSRVSSNFLSEMTNGARSKIELDNNFDITIDGQPVETLSGSGKAVGNLAIRLGLGTVLTNKVFSVLFADEVDASMDDERAAYTAQCLRNLTKVFGQIILVSHQKPQADHYIEL